MHLTALTCNSITAILSDGCWCLHTPSVQTFFPLAPWEDSFPNIWYSSRKLRWYPWKLKRKLTLSGAWPQDPYSSSCEISIWLVDAPPLLPSASPLRSAGRCGHGSVQQPPSRRGVPDGAGLSYSWPMGSRSPMWPPRSASTVALFTSGCSGFSRRAWRGWQINKVVVAGVGRVSLRGQSSTMSAHEAPASRGEYGRG